MLPPEDICNWSPGFSSLVIWEETPHPLPVGFPADGLPKLTRHHCVVVASCHCLDLLLDASGKPALPGGPFRLGVSYQARVETPLPEFHAPHYTGPDISGPADSQRLGKNAVGKYKGYLGVLTPAKNPPPFRIQYCCEAAHYCSRGRDIPAF